MLRAALLKQAKVKAAKYCSTRERAPFEVLQKLQSWEISENEAQEILAELIEERFVDERRFCKAFCHDKFEFNHWGRNKIQQALYQYRLPEEVVKEGFLAIDPERYESTLLELATKKWNALMDDEWKKKQKTITYLLGKGFEMDLAFEAIKRLTSK